jgi:hypothetical protein
MRTRRITSNLNQVDTSDVHVHVSTRPRWEFSGALNPYYYDRATQEELRRALSRPSLGAI